METALNATVVILSVFYTLVVVAYARIFARGPVGVAAVVRPIFLITLAVHVVLIALRSAILEACPLASQSDVLTLVAFSIGLIYLVLELRIGERSTGVFVVTPAFVLQFVAAVGALGSEPARQTQMGINDSLHVFAAIIGLSSVLVCSVYGLLYISLYAGIKYGRFGLFYRKMPSLETLSELNFVATWLAFLGLSGMLGFGISSTWVEDTHFELWQPEVVLGVLLWTLYGLCLLAKHFLGMGGKRLAYSTALGLLFAVGILAFGFVGHTLPH
jgi:ABC-type uncharacterized transport system permease subunit